MLKRFSRSPAHLKHWMQDRPKRTAAMRLGGYIHSAILEPESWACCAIEPDRPRPTSRQLGAKKPSPESVALIEFWNAWDEEHKHRQIVSADDHELACAVAASVRSHSIASEAIGDAREVSAFGFMGGDVFCKARFDCPTEGNAILDIKSTEDARPWAFSKAIFEFGYHLQAAFYLDLWNILNPSLHKTHFVFIVVEKSPPYAVSVLNLAEEAIDLGRATYQTLLPLYRQCVEFDSWPAYPEGITTVELPPWAAKQSGFVFA
jgi:exodeoxyribonuclease VIII